MRFPVNHDLHVHTGLSRCCKDPGMTAEYICGHAARQGYDLLCITDHYWDADVPGGYADVWQEFERLKLQLPLSEAQGVRVLFGCETDFCGKQSLGVPPPRYDAFDFIAVAVNHFHLNTVNPEGLEGEALAALYMDRLEELLALELPWKKVGIAHLNRRCGHILGLLPEDRLCAVFRRLAEYGAGIELNASCLGPNWMDSGDGTLRCYQLALAAGCKFYCGSDAHKREALELVPQRLRAVADAIGLTADDRFVPSS